MLGFHGGDDDDDYGGDDDDDDDDNAVLGLGAVWAGW
jgi:hypothetical protein